MNKIHPTAVVSPDAKLGDEITISPYAIIYDDVEIGNGTYIGPHAVLHNGARVGNNVKIYQGASVSHIPQDLKFKEEPTYCYVGDNTTLHEFVTLHRGSNETQKTVIGSKVLLMAYSHVAHDCVIGNNCIIANSVQIGGFVEMDDFAIIGGCTPIHQFCKVGMHCMVGGGFRIIKDVPPYILAGEEPLHYAGLNTIGLRRRGFSNEEITTLKDVYHLIYEAGMNVSQAKEKIIEKYSGNQRAMDVVDFINRSKRGLIPR